MTKDEKHIIVKKDTHKLFKDMADEEGRKHDFLIKDMIKVYKERKK